MRNRIVLLGFICLLPFISKAQNTSELIYPVVPLADDCHFLFNDTAKIRVISKEDFQSIDKLWTTYNLCYSMDDDTLFAKSYQMTFVDITGRNTGVYGVTNGVRENDHISSLVSRIERIKPYTKVLISDIQYEKDGAMYQIPAVTYYIDSIVEPKEDTCWRLLPDVISGNNTPIRFINSVTKERLSRILLDSIGINMCTGLQEWPDTSLVIMATIGPGKVRMSKDGSYPKFKHVGISQQKENSKLLAALNELKDGDIIQLSQTLYLKNNEYYRSRFYHFNIEQFHECKAIHNIDSMTQDSVQKMVKYLRSLDQYERLCISSSDGLLVKFNFIHSNHQSRPIFRSQYDGYISREAWLGIKDLKSGDKLIMENINTATEDDKGRHYSPFIIIIE